MRRSSLLALLLLASMLAAGCGQYGKEYKPDANGSDAEAIAQERVVSKEKFNDTVKKRDGCTGPEELESEGNSHTEEKVTFKHNPPHSGDHSPIPADWGRYDKQQPDANTTHNLEHGHVVISYKGLSDKLVDELIADAKINPFHLLVQPRAKNPKDGVYYMAWTTEVYCKEPSRAALQYMIDNYRDQGPELFTEDAGGGSMGSGDNNAP